MKQFWVLGFVVVLLVGSTLLATRISQVTAQTPLSPMLVAEGSITGLTLQLAEPKLSVTDKEGNVLKLVIDPNATLDPNATIVSEYGSVVQPDRLETGQQVKVQYTEEGNKKVARYIKILTPEPMPNLAEEQPTKEQPTTK